jgi:hypothetical protein
LHEEVRRARDCNDMQSEPPGPLVAGVQIEAFLRGPTQKHTVRGFKDTGAAQKWAWKYFSKDRACAGGGSGYSATAEVGDGVDVVVVHPLAHNPAGGVLSCSIRHIILVIFMNGGTYT